MKQKLLLFGILWLFLGASLMAQNQYEIQFNYDAAGNQTSRDRVCINCGSSKEAVDSTLVEDIALEEDILDDLAGLDESGSSRIAAYPNPVTNILTVEWLDNQKEVAQIILFSGIGRQLLQRNVTSKQGSLELDFARYPQGRYIISVFYTDKTKQTFHVLKR